MALADIIKRIEDDAHEECERVAVQAEERIQALLGDARERAEAESARIVETERRATEADAATRVASARLAARDEALRARRELVEEALERTVAAIEALPQADFAAFLSDAVAANVRSGDTIALSAVDAGLLDAVREHVAAAAPGIDVAWSIDAAPVERGALVAGPRTSVEITSRSIVAGNRGELEVAVASELFVDGEA